MLASDAVDYVQPSPIKMGGISELRKVFQLDPGGKVTVMPHTFYDGPGLLAGVHAIAALSKHPMVEWRYFDLEQRLYGDAGTPQAGSIAVPQGPGLGMDPDLDVIQRYEIK
jgi:L-alanine-DL-glutamate epimerase-like enolase superfamily enzyme